MDEMEIWAKSVLIAKEIDLPKTVIVQAPNVVGYFTVLK